MDVNELFRSCKTGELRKVRHLVEHNEIELNVRDNWDCTPLYYACLCGHVDVVHYLLENGAKCQANTFDGERCLYGALTDDIRNLLWNFNVISSKTIQRDTYDEFLRRCYEEMEYSDVTFNVQGEMFPAHKCILAARSPYFKKMFCGEWKSLETVKIKHRKIKPFAFDAVVLRLLYTGHLEITTDQIDDCLLVSQYFKLNKLTDEIIKAVQKCTLYERSKPGVKITMIRIGDQHILNNLQTDTALLAYHAMPPELRNPIQEPSDGIYLSQFADVCLQVQGFNFHCNQVFFCGRSAYFKALFSDHFNEKKYNSGLPVFNLNEIEVDNFVAVLHFVYQNGAELSGLNTLDLICAADLFMLPGLKRLCANHLASQLDIKNAVEVLKLARALDQPRLEESCTKFLADNLSQMVNDLEFRELVVQDAREVKQRHETDSIGVIDDIRFHITRNVQTFSAIETANQQLTIVDKLLQELGLEA